MPLTNSPLEKDYSKPNTACADHPRSCLAPRSLSKTSEAKQVPQALLLQHSTTLPKLDHSGCRAGLLRRRISLGPGQRNRRMEGPTSRRDGMIEDQPSGLYPSYFEYKKTSVAPIVQYVDTSNNTYISSVFAGDENYNTPLPYNIWPTGTVGALDMPFADAITSLNAPTNYMPIPLPSPLNGTIPAASDEWQIQGISLMQTSTGMPWGFTFQTASDTINNPTTSARSSEASLPNIQHFKPTDTFLSNATTDLSRSERLPDSPANGLPRRRSMSCATGPTEATTFKTNTLRPGDSQSCNIDLLQTPISPVSDGGSSTPGIDNQTSPRRPGSSRRTSSSGDTQRNLRSLPPTPRLKQPARSRAAAIKCRAKSKAAAAELEATEKAESLRREQLLATFRSLQEEVLALKSEILLHGNCGDVMIQKYLNSAAGSFLTSYGGPAEWAPFGGSSIPDSRYLQSPP